MTPREIVRVMIDAGYESLIYWKDRGAWELIEDGDELIDTDGGELIKLDDTMKIVRVVQELIDRNEFTEDDLEDLKDEVEDEE